MNNFFSYINQPLPIGIAILIAVVVLWLRVNDNIKAVHSLKGKIEAQFKWCLDHFEIKKGGSKE